MAGTKDISFLSGTSRASSVRTSQSRGSVYTMRSQRKAGSPRKDTQSSSIQSTSSLLSDKQDNVRDGKFFHIRVTVGYLTCFRTAVGGDNYGSSALVTAYASFSPTAAGRGEYDYATSMPIAPGVPRQNIKWPKGSEAKTSMRRLYHTVLLRADDSEIVKSDSILDEAESPNTASIYGAELVNIYIGVQRGGESVCLGAATLVVNGKLVDGQKMDLPLRKVKAHKKKASKRTPQKESPMKKSGGLSKLFGGMRKERGTMDTVKSKFEMTKSNPLVVDAKQYSFEKNSVLQVKLDVMEGLYETNGPSLWGDLEDDEESFGPVPVIDIPENYTTDLTDKYRHESIEVLDFKHGTTILASPGTGVAVEQSGLEDHVHREVPEIPSEIGNFARGKALKGGAYYLCGAVPLDDFSTTAEGETSMSGSETATRTTYEETQRNRSRGSISHVSESSHTFEGTSTYGGDSDSECDGETEDERSRNLREAEAATSILLRYASKLGVPVEELLDAAGDSAFDGSSYASSRMDGTFNDTVDHSSYDESEFDESRYRV